MNLFTKMYSLTKDNKILIFNYRLLHRNTITNKNLHLWDQNKPEHEQRTDLCTFCNNHVETIEHIFYDCLHIKKIWSDLFDWIYDNCNIHSCHIVGFPDCRSGFCNFGILCQFSSVFDGFVGFLINL